MKTRKQSGNAGLQIGDRVKLVAGTLAWSGEVALQGKIGEVIECPDDGTAMKRFTVRFPGGRLLIGREAGLFERA